MTTKTINLNQVTFQDVLELSQRLSRTDLMRLLTQLNLHISQLESVQIDTLSSSLPRERVHSILVKAGLSLPSRLENDGPTPLSEEARDKLGRSIPPGSSLSALIIEERQAGF